MGQFIEFIFDNMFIVILVISGLIGVLSNNKEQQKKEQQKKTQQQRSEADKPKPTSRPSGPIEQKRRPTYEPRTQSQDKEVVSTASIADERQVQMEKLKEKFGGVTSEDLSKVDISKYGLQIDQPFKELTEEQKVLQKDIRSGLNNRGLINGIIMAEVLGKPRSLKPYESVTIERYKK